MWEPCPRSSPPGCGSGSWWRPPRSWNRWPPTGGGARALGGMRGVGAAVPNCLREGKFRPTSTRRRRISPRRHDALLTALDTHLPRVVRVIPADGGLGVWGAAEGIDVDEWA